MCRSTCPKPCFSAHMDYGTFHALLSVFPHTPSPLCPHVTYSMSEKFRCLFFVMSMVLHCVCVETSQFSNTSRDRNTGIRTTKQPIQSRTSGTSTAAAWYLFNALEHCCSGGHVASMTEFLGQTSTSTDFHKRNSCHRRLDRKS